VDEEKPNDIPNGIHLSNVQVNNDAITDSDYDVSTGQQADGLSQKTPGVVFARETATYSRDITTYFDQMDGIFIWDHDTFAVSHWFMTLITQGRPSSIGLRYQRTQYAPGWKITEHKHDGTVRIIKDESFNPNYENPDTVNYDATYIP
jgi:hypothetical protein